MSNNYHNLPSLSKFEQWLTSMNSLLEDIPALEVTTTIVEEITPEIFIPWEVYQNIYQISPAYLQSIEVETKLCDRYIDLRRRLELQYALLLVNPDSKLYNSRLRSKVQTDLPILAKSATKWEELPTRLPSPESISDQQSWHYPGLRKQTLRDRDTKTLGKLLQEPQFLITLRQLGKLKDILDLQAANRKNVETEDTINYQITPNITYAQTSIKIDGKIANCYSQEILKLDLQQQKNIIKLHNQGILAAEKQWHHLIKFILKTLKFTSHK